MASTLMYSGVKAAATMGSGGLSEPLMKVPEEVSINVTDDESVGRSKNNGDTNPASADSAIVSLFSAIMVFTLSASAFAASVAAMISVPTAAVFVAGSICCLNTPNSIRLHLATMSAPTLRNSISILREQINAFAETVDILSKTVETLQDEVDDLKLSEVELERIADKQGSNVKKMVELVKENEKTLNSMKFNLRETCVAHMLKLVIRADKDGDMKIDPEEGKILILSLNIEMKSYGVELDTDLFRDMLLEDNSVENIVRFCSMVLYPEIALKKEVREEELRNDDHSDDHSDDDDFFAPDSNRLAKKTPSAKFRAFIAHVSTMSDDQLDDMKLTVEEKLGMISISDKYSQGSVEVAQGRKSSIIPTVGNSKRSTRIQKMKGESRKRCSEVETRMTKRISILQNKKNTAFPFVRAQTSAEF